MRRLLFAWLFLLLAHVAWAQEEITVTKVLVQGGAGYITITSSGATPEGAVTAPFGSIHSNWNDGKVYRKGAGGADTGWQEVYTIGSVSAEQVLIGPTSGSAIPTFRVLALSDLPSGAGGTVLAGTDSSVAFTATPTVTTLTADTVAAGAVTANTVVASTSVTTPTITATANLTLSPVGDLYLNPTGNDVLPAVSYDINIGQLSAKYLTLHAAELWVETLVAQNTIATIGGRILVGPTTVLTADLAAAGTQVTVKHNQMVNGDRIYMEADGKVEFMAITSGATGSGPYIYDVSRNLDGTGANDWFAGDALFNTGQAGNGFIDLYSVRGVRAGTEVGPTIVGNVRIDGTFNNWSPRWAIGNLNGLYGIGSTTYGVAMGDPAASNILITAAAGITIRHGTTNKFFADTSGNLSLVGDLSIGTAGVFRSGATAFGTTTGYWLDFNGGTPRLRVGNPAGNRVSWDGTDITVISDNFTVDGTGVTIDAQSSTESGARAYRFTGIANDAGEFGMFGTAWTITPNVSSSKVINARVENFNTTTATRTAVVQLAAAGHVSDGTQNAQLRVVGGSGTTTVAIALTAADSTLTWTDFAGLSFASATSVTTPASPSIAFQSGNGFMIRPKTGSTYDFSIVNAGNTAYLLTNPTGTNTVQIHAALTLAFCGAATVTTNASGVVACASDSRLKQKIEDYGHGLKEILQLRPVTYQWRPESGLDDGGRYVGFLADDVQKVLPLSGGTDVKGFKTLNDRAIIAALVTAVQELEARLRWLESKP